MSEYTTEVRFICETFSGLTESASASQTDAVIQTAIPHIFTFNFPIFDESYRNVIETKFLRHYYTREIAFETVGLWLLKLNTKFNEIMPLYNQFYQSTKLQFDPFNDINLSRTHNTKNNGSTSGTNDNSISNTHKDSISTNGTNSSTSSLSGNSTDEKTDAYSDTPMGSLDNVTANKYLSSYEDIKNTGTHSQNGTTSSTVGNTTNSTITDDQSGTGSNSSSFSNTQDYLESLTGKQSTESYSERLLKYRETFLNLDMKVIDECSDLFFNLY